MVAVTFISNQGKAVTYMAASMEQAEADIRNFNYFGMVAKIAEN